MNLNEAYMRASENHLKRVEVLQGVEWKVAFALWAAIGLATSTALLNMEKVHSLLVTFQTPLAFAYVAIGASYLFGFCCSNYNSLVTERNRYQYFQDLALHASQAPATNRILKDAVNANPSSSTHQESKLAMLEGFNMTGSQTWFFKSISTHIALLLSYLSLTMTASSIEAKTTPVSVHLNGIIIILLSFSFYCFIYCCSKRN